jgi:methylenetetrahydrofolate dehydrogenase (NADP+) / methenyltetrahydrofolate cyclohydrolase
MLLTESMTSTSGAKIIDGRRHARDLREALRIKAGELTAKFGAPPKLTVISVGDDAASRLYVANKSKACRDVGIESVVIELAAATPLDTLLAVIEAQNRDPSVHGILVQLPLPRHLPVRMRRSAYATRRRATWLNSRFSRTSWWWPRASPI